MNVLVIPEDFRKDQYVLKPILRKMMQSLGSKARVEVCRDPLLGGVGEALKWERLAEILDRYRGMVRLFLLVVDRDCVDGRRSALDHLEQRAAEFFSGTDRTFLAEAAQEEVEVWVLAGMNDLPKKWAWTEVREECHSKERFYEPYAKQRGLLEAPYEGRERLAKEAAGNYGRIRQLCPEDVGALESRVRSALEVTSTRK
jgi:hypothetical protein